MDIYCGNLPFEWSESDVTALFQPFDPSASTTLVTDKYSGKSRGFAFVSVADEAQGLAAITALNGREFLGRDLKVSLAKPRKDFA